jgi:preprotein translocase subunit SecA
MARGLLDRALRMGEARQFKEHERRVESINRVEPEMELLDDDELRTEANELRQRAANGESLEALLPESWARPRPGAGRPRGPPPKNENKKSGRTGRSPRCAPARGRR